MGLKPIIGTRLMLSTPAHTKASPAPMRIAPAAWWTDCMDEPQKRFTVTPAGPSPPPAREATTLATGSPQSAGAPPAPAGPDVRMLRHVQPLLAFREGAAEHQVFDGRRVQPRRLHQR